MRRADVTIALCALAVAGVAGCGGADGSDPTSSTGTATAPAQTGLTARVVDGDTGAPIPNAVVSAFDDTDQLTQLGPSTTPDASGRWTLPEGATIAYAQAPGHVPDRNGVTIAPGRTSEVRVPLYSPELQSPEYGGGPQRTRHVPAVRLPAPNRPPTWRYTGKALLEFPPAVSNGTAVIVTNPGRIIAFNSRTGRIRWQRRHNAPGSEVATTPAIIQQDNRVLIAGMDGRLGLHDLGTGALIERFTSGGSPIETSPLVIGDSVFVGTHQGRIYKLDRVTLDQRCSFATVADVKGSPAQAGRNIVFADYAGYVYAMRIADCRQVWRVRVGKRFYGGPAVSGGRVVIGDVGGGVLALNPSNGRVVWRHATGGPVYSSPAIANGTVFIGSFDGDFEALSLADGSVRWTFPAGGRIGGSATVVGDVVYTSVLARPGEQDRTWGLNVRTGGVAWRFDDGRYSPAVGAGRTLLIVGRTSLYGYTFA